MYTEVLATVLRDKGPYAAPPHVDESTHDYYRKGRAAYRDKLATKSGRLRQVVVTAITRA